jgi:hypothetical protein
MCLSCVTMLQQDRTCTWRMVPCGTRPGAEPKLPRWSAWYNASYCGVLLRFAAAALLHYCAYSTGDSHAPLPRPSVVQFSQCLHDRVPHPPRSRGLDSRSLSLLLIAQRFLWRRSWISPGLRLFVPSSPGVAHILLAPGCCARRKGSPSFGADLHLVVPWVAESRPSLGRQSMVSNLLYLPSRHWSAIVIAELDTGDFAAARVLPN